MLSSFESQACGVGVESEGDIGQGGDVAGGSQDCGFGFPSCVGEGYWLSV